MHVLFYTYDTHIEPFVHLSVNIIGFEKVGKSYRCRQKSANGTESPVSPWHMLQNPCITRLINNAWPTSPRWSKMGRMLTTTCRVSIFSQTFSRFWAATSDTWGDVSYSWVTSSSNAHVSGPSSAIILPKCWVAYNLVCCQINIASLLMYLLCLELVKVSHTM